MNEKIAIVTGGTGGHIFPAITTADALISHGFEVIILGDQKYKKYHKIDNNFQ